MSKKLPYDLTEEEIQDLRNQKKRISEFVMKQFNREKQLSKGKPHLFKMTLDDGFASYQYDITLNENWSMFEIQQEIANIVKRYKGSISCGELCGAGYLENEKEKN